ncbi:hypothetical protein SuNHUV7_41200 (plasmid) [Pseudoseohaeicola sp. NH-UV-7]|uniref:lipopolysaccharide biosynthesis protein n=1 Tax=Sulfitobacter sp. TBRI5 TaxID=2989732 RepID=UPI003A61D752
MTAANKTYLAGAAAVGLSSALGAGAGFVSLFLLTRILTKEDVGGYAFAFSLLQLLSFITIWGSDRYILLNVAQYPPQQGVLLEVRLALRLALIASLAAFGTGIGLWVAADALVAAGAIETAAFWVPALAFALVPMSASTIFIAWFRANHRAALSSLMYGLTDVSRAILFACIFLLGAGSKAIAAVVVLSSFTPLLALGLVARGQAHADLCSTENPTKTRPLFNVLGKLATYGLRIFDIILVGMFSDAETTAIYAVAARLAVFCALGSEAMQPSFAPRARGHIVRGDATQSQLELHRARAAALLLTLTVAGCLTLVGPMLLGLFGGFEASFAPLLVLMAGYVLASGAGLLISMLSMSEEIVASTMIRLAALGVFFATAVPLIQWHGASGAAAAFAVAQLAVISSTVVFSRAKLGFWALDIVSGSITCMATAVLFLAAAGHLSSLAAGVLVLAAIPVLLVADSHARVLPGAALRALRGQS